MLKHLKSFSRLNSSNLPREEPSDSEANNESQSKLLLSEVIEVLRKEDDPRSLSGNPHLKEIDSQLQILLEEKNLEETENNSQKDSIIPRKEILVLLSERFLVSQALFLKSSEESGEDLRTTISEVYEQLEKLEGEENRGFVEKISSSLKNISDNDLTFKANMSLLELMLDQNSEENERILFHEISQLVEKDPYSCFFWILKTKTLLESNRIKGIVALLVNLLSKCFQEVENNLPGEKTELLSSLRQHQVEAIAEHAFEGDKGKLFTNNKFKRYTAGLIKQMASEENSLLQFQRTFGFADSQDNLGRCLELRKIFEEVSKIYDGEESLDLLKKCSSLSRSSAQFICNLIPKNQRKLANNALSKLKYDNHESIKEQHFKQLDLFSSRSLNFKEVFSKFETNQAKIDFLFSLLHKTRLVEALPILNLLIDTVQEEGAEFLVLDQHSTTLTELLLNISINYLNFINSNSSLLFEILGKLLILANIMSSKAAATGSTFILLKEKEYSSFVI